MLQEIKRILYASDLGKGSRPAFRSAVQHAIKHEAEIIYFHAIEPLSELTEDVIEDYLPEELSQKHSGYIMQNKKTRIKERIQNFLDSELTDTDYADIPISIKVLIGSPDKLIISAAEAEKADMIVIGDREASSLSRLFLGSTALKVLNQSEIPVLIVPLQKL